MSDKVNLSPDFYDALADYSFLIERDYPITATIKLIGDRYRLSGLERSILLRGMVKKNIAINRKKKIVKEKHLDNEELLIDCYNVLITIVSYLSGDFAYIAADGYLRDAAESHGNIKKESSLTKALNLLFEYLSKLNLAKVFFYLDSPISKSGELDKKIKILLLKYNIDGNSEVVKSADYYLIKSKSKISATSDSAIIDKTEKIFDLARQTLKHHFKPDFFSLEDIVRIK